MIKFSELLILFGLISVMHTLSMAQNPITPSGIYIADPSAHVWPDGKLYIYGSLDESCDYYCSHRHHIMVSENMQEWTIYKNVFVTQGSSDDVPYNDLVLYAPDCALRNDSFYLYYCQPSLDYTEGVAASASPTGPFVGAQNLERDGYHQIDPSVFVDDDGQVYYMWGQFSLKMAKLNDDMRSLDFSTFQDSVLTESAHFFHEGAYMTKRKGVYYLVFADISRADMPTCIGYATSSSPFGPYTYGGVIVDNDQCNPGNWNNHGSIAEFNNQWYVFYHRSTHGCNKMRKACVEPISFLCDGSIPEVEMTSQGAGGPLKMNTVIEAEWACVLQGNIRIQAFSKSQEEIAQMKNGDKAFFKYVDFGEGAEKMKIRINPGGDGGKIGVFAAQAWHQKLAEVEIIPSPGQSDWKIITLDLKKIPGIQAILLQFNGDGEDMFAIDWISFQ